MHRVLAPDIGTEVLRRNMTDTRMRHPCPRTSLGVVIRDPAGSKRPATFRPPVYGESTLSRERDLLILVDTETRPAPSRTVSVRASIFSLFDRTHDGHGDSVESSFFANRKISPGKIPVVDRYRRDWFLFFLLFTR